jgi:hypoxia up-regulated 1
MVLNIQSKRKTPSVVSFHEDVRQFGDDGLALQGKGPKKTLMYFPYLLGKNLTGVPDVSAGKLGYHERYYPFDIFAHETRKVPTFKVGDKEMVMEEAAAHVFGFAKSIAEMSDDGAEVREIVVTVPATATQRQRRAVMDAAEIAGFKKISIAHETTSAAVNRATDLNYAAGGNATEKNTTHTLIFNMGSVHTEVCVVSFAPVEHQSKPVPSVKVLACTVVDKLGGHYIDLLIADQMLQGFKTKYPKLASIDGSIRALKKLLVQAQATKHVLSANKDAQFRVESLYEDTDFFAPFSRQLLEDLTKDTFALIPSAIDEAVALSGLEGGLAAIDEVEVVGGGWRIPKVQQLLLEHINANREAKLDLGQHLNGEEAMASGAAFIIANSSAAFRVKKIFLTDISKFDYTVIFTALDSTVSDEAKDFKKVVPILPTGTALSKLKKMNLKVDFNLQMELLENDNLVTTYTMKGFGEEKMKKYEHLGKPTVSVVVGLDASGIFKVSAADATWKENVTQNETEPEDADGTAANASVADTENSSSNASTDATSKPKKPKKPKVLSHFVELQVTTIEHLPLPMSEEDKKAAIERYKAAQEFDAEVKATMGAKNTLEAYIYEARDAMDAELSQQVSTEEVRAEVTSLCTTIEEWLYDDGANAKKADYDDKYVQIQDKLAPIKLRASEIEARVQLEELIPQGLEYISKTLKYVKANMSWVTKEDTGLVENMTKDFETWYENVTTQQKATPLTEPLVFEANEAKMMISRAYQEAQRLTRIQYIPPRPYERDPYGYGGYGGYNYSNYNWSNFNRSGFNYSDYFRNQSNYSGFNWNDSSDEEYMKRFRDYADSSNSGENTGGSGSSESSGDTGSSGTGAGNDGAAPDSDKAEL